MKTQVRKWGNSLAVRIPRSLAAEARIADYTVLDFTVQDGALVACPVPPGLRLDDLVAGVTEDNIHREADYGLPVGREIS